MRIRVLYAKAVWNKPCYLEDDMEVDVKFFDIDKQRYYIGTDDEDSEIFIDNYDFLDGYAEIMEE